MTVRLTAPRRSARVPDFDRRLLRRRAGAVLRATNRAAAELSVTLVSDPEIAALNERYRAVSGPTDVLSFSLAEGDFADHAGALLGDVVIGLGTAARQAQRAARSLDDELARLLIHGVLHLLGHDHAEAAEARVMRAEEQRILEALPG